MTGEVLLLKLNVTVPVREGTFLIGGGGGGWAGVF